MYRGGRLPQGIKKSHPKRGLGWEVLVYSVGAKVFQTQIQNGSGVGESTAGDKVYAGFGDLPQPGLGHIAAALGLGTAVNDLSACFMVAVSILSSIIISAPASTASCT